MALRSCRGPCSWWLTWEKSLLGVPACALHHPVTALDLVLPRILAGEHIGKLELALLGHGGFAGTARNAATPLLFRERPLKKIQLP